MDLLGDLGAADQLTSARAENSVLSKKVKELTEKVKELTLENQQLLAEVEIYRKEASALPSVSVSEEVKSSQKIDAAEQDDVFFKSGNGVYPSDPVLSLSKLHGVSNPLCCALDVGDVVLATGGADGYVTLSSWGAALSPHVTSESVVQEAVRIRCGAPVICVAFGQDPSVKHICAAGCMDGSVRLFGYQSVGSNLQAEPLATSTTIKHDKYVKSCVWSPTAAVLATASADGTVILSKVTGSESDTMLETMQTLHLSGAVEAMCFSNNGDVLYCYARGTPYLSCFDLKDGCQHSKLNLNSNGVNGGFEDHVSFAVMDMSPSPNNGGKYLALATDTSRNIILDATTGKQIRNLYGHKNDGFSQPKIAWSHSGLYLFGNTQTDNSICVWDIASSSIVKSLEAHTGQVRDLFSSRSSDTLVTTSFDKNTKIWTTPLPTWEVCVSYETTPM